mmetsp:Transcript_5408/g.12767  ORF Transcript_5408/g.12767 Transcript_5408/m.12767 type:complete len:471 (-) Transcript_5408:85-1497(-)
MSSTPEEAVKKTLEIPPAGVTKIGSEAHANDCSLLSCVDMRRASELEIIGKRAFYQCKRLLQVLFAPNLRIVQAQAFQSCDKLETVGLLFENTNNDKVVNHHLTEIGAHAFRDCASLTQMPLPPTITTLGEGVFSKCVKLQTVSLPPNLNAIPKRAFFGCLDLLQVFNLESTRISRIGESSFDGCLQLKEIGGIPPFVETIAAWAFMGCMSLSSLDLTRAFRLETIGRAAFQDCVSLTLLNLSNTVLEVIQEGAFRGCSSLREVQLNAELIEIESNAFACCCQLRLFAFHPSGRLKTIGPSAFQKCEALPFLEFPSSLESIDCEAFSGCSNLNSVQFQQEQQQQGSLLTCIAEDAFFGCVSLKDVTIPSSVAYLMENAFDVDYLERIDIQGGGGGGLELCIRLWRMYPDAYVGLPVEKWCYLYCHHDKKFCSVMTKKDLEKLVLVKREVADKLYNLMHWSISVGSIGNFH